VTGGPLDLPWGRLAVETVDLEAVRRALARGHVGHDHVKEQIVDSVALARLKLCRGLRSGLGGPPLAFVGPPGVGREQLVSAVARATGRPLVTVRLAGVETDAELRGRAGVRPGRLIEAIAQAGVDDPVLLLRDVDAVPAGSPVRYALLDLVDPYRSRTFVDAFLDAPYDLSNAMVIATARDAASAPDLLRDRFEVFELGGYTEDEKVRIAREFLLPEILAGLGLAAGEVRVDAEAILTVVRRYTDEPGVSQLARRLGDLVGRAVTRRAGADLGPAEVEALLGASPAAGPAPDEATPGTAAGLAMVAGRPTVVPVEIALAPGTGRLRFSGDVESVLEEAAQVAWSAVQLRADRIGLAAAPATAGMDLHVHLRGAAGHRVGDASLGLPVLLAMASSLTGRALPPRLVAVGEITLRGPVLPAGRLEELLRAARRAGLGAALVPRANQADVDDLPADLRDGLEIATVATIEEALMVALPGLDWARLLFG
jgi:ATP-dependent Lon protease